jgi:hypothetical protein
VASASTAVRNAVIAALNTEFAAEGITFKHDKMHPAMGLSGPVGAVYPDGETERPGRVIEQVTVVYVQVFRQWTKEVDPAQEVDPTTTEAWANRVKTRLKGAQNLGTGDVWYFRVTTVAYMDDPTGNRTRFLARVQAHGGNPNLVETGP